MHATHLTVEGTQRQPWRVETRRMNAWNACSRPPFGCKLSCPSLPVSEPISLHTTGTIIGSKTVLGGKFLLCHQCMMVEVHVYLSWVFSSSSAHQPVGLNFFSMFQIKRRRSSLRKRRPMLHFLEANSKKKGKSLVPRM